MTSSDELGALHARVIADASKVFDDLATQIGEPSPAAHGPAPAGDPVGEQQLRTAGARLIDLFTGLYFDGLEAYLELARSLLQGPRDGATASSTLGLRGRAGARAATIVWMHARAGQPAGEALLRLTDLHSAAGARIGASLAAFEPTRVRLEGGASSSSILSVAIPPHATPGSYFGHVLVSGVAAGGLALELVVDAPGE